jgi:hypothetical protein
MDRGILDRTHLQFFTRDTALDMLKEAACGDEGVLHRRAAGRVVESGEGGLMYRRMMRSQHLGAGAGAAGLRVSVVFVAAARIGRTPQGREDEERESVKRERRARCLV